MKKKGSFALAGDLFLLKVLANSEVRVFPKIRTLLNYVIDYK